MEKQGFRCEMLQMAGGNCQKKSSNNSYTFTRLETGFEYIVKSSGYLLDIRWSDDSKGDYITFKTTAEAINGYRNNFYTCSYKENIVKEIDKCVDENENELDLPAYTSIINRSMYDLDLYITNSGYNKKKLLEDHEWSKK